MTKHNDLLYSGQATNGDMCKCPGRPPIVLQSTLSTNPIACADCNLEVKINLSDELTEEINAWQEQFDSLYIRWLNSGDDEKFAADQLSSPTSEINIMGLTLTRRIMQTHSCYYWWFLDNSTDNYERLAKCPICNEDLVKRANKFNLDTYTCERCNIIVAD